MLQVLDIDNFCSFKIIGHYGPVIIAKVVRMSTLCIGLAEDRQLPFLVGNYLYAL